MWYYLHMSAKIISPDDIKEGLDGYRPENSEVFHSESVKIADKEFKNALRSQSSPTSVILMCGGSASGKSEYIETYLNKENSIIYDGTLSTIEGAKVKIRNCKRYHKNVKVIAVITNSLPKSFYAFINRIRKYSIEDFYRSHIGSRETLKYIFKNYNDIEIVFIESYSDGEANLKFREIKLKDLEAYVNNFQITQEEIEKQILKFINI